MAVHADEVISIGDTHIESQRYESVLGQPLIGLHRRRRVSAELRETSEEPPDLRRGLSNARMDVDEIVLSFLQGQVFGDVAACHERYVGFVVEYGWDGLTHKRDAVVGSDDLC